jgi:hypothetical protein
MGEGMDEEARVMTGRLCDAEGILDWDERANGWRLDWACDVHLIIANCPPDKTWHPDEIAVLHDYTHRNELEKAWEMS